MAGRHKMAKTAKHKEGITLSSTSTRTYPAVTPQAYGEQNRRTVLVI